MKLLTRILLLVTIACVPASEKGNTKNQEKELGLETLQDKKEFLERIFEDDQLLRGSEGQEIMLKFGRKSKEYKDYVQNRIDRDVTNLRKVESYLIRYGHPSKDEMGEIAALTPWTVIHHSQTMEDRERNFKYINKGYENGDIDEGAMSMFLGRLYEIKFGERFKMDGPFKSEDEIEALIAKLKLKK